MPKYAQLKIHGRSLTRKEAIDKMHSLSDQSKHAAIQKSKSYNLSPVGILAIPAKPEHMDQIRALMNKRISESKP